MNIITDVPGIISIASFRRKNSFVIDEVSLFEELLIIYMPNFKHCLHMAKYTKKKRVRKIW